MKRLLLILLIALPASAQLFVRGGVGWERTRSSAVRDLDCSSTNPPALFGCGFEARGDFGTSPSFELGIGAGRAELLVTRRALDLEAEANFTGVTGEQPVTAEGSSLAAMVVVTQPLGRASWRVRPFVSAGGGIARNDIDPIRYAFPGLGDNAVTITRGGTNTGFAWSAAAGASTTLTPKLSLDLSLRYADLGEVETTAGAATIIRPSRELTIDIAGTRADLKTLGVGMSLRWQI